MSKTIGSALKEARTTRNLSPQQVASDTKIPRRHIDALESGNFNLFPGETYTVGFLRSYSSYLGLDPDKIIQQYKNEVMVNIDTPLKELTQASITTIDYFIGYSKYALISIAIISIVILSLNFFDFSSEDFIKKSDKKFNAEFSIENYLKESGKVPNEKTESVNFANGTLFALVKEGEGIDFPLKNNEVYIILKKLSYKATEGKANEAELEIYPGRQKVQLSEEVPALLHFPWLAKKIMLNLLGSTPHNIKIKVTQLGDNEQYNEEYGSQKNENETDSQEERLKPENFTINLVARTTAENYVEFYIDGKQKRRGMLPIGEVLRYEANNSIQMKIGDAGSIDVTINGKPLKKGRKGQQISKIIRKVKDPVEQLKFRLEIKDT